MSVPITARSSKNDSKNKIVGFIVQCNYRGLPNAWKTAAKLANSKTTIEQTDRKWLAVALAAVKLYTVFRSPAKDQPFYVTSVTVLFTFVADRNLKAD